MSSHIWIQLHVSCEIVTCAKRYPHVIHPTVPMKPKKGKKRLRGEHVSKLEWRRKREKRHMDALKGTVVPYQDVWTQSTEKTRDIVRHRVPSLLVAKGNRTYFKSDFDGSGGALIESLEEVKSISGWLATLVD